MRSQPGRTENQVNPDQEDLKKTLTGFFLNHNSELTKKEYAYAVRELLSLSQVNAPGELKRHHLIYYREYLEKKALANKTILKKLSAVSSFCRYLLQEEIIGRDITQGIKRPRTRNKCETSDFTDEEVKRIFNCLDPKRYNFEAYRAMLAVGFYTGLRSREIRYLRLKNLAEIRGHRVISTVTKGDKNHEVPLNPFVVRCLNEHLEKLTELGFNLDQEHFLFPRLKPKVNQPVSRAGFSYILGSCLKKAGIELSEIRRYSPHSMRATFAGHLLSKEDVKLDDVQGLLGHSSPATTQKYNKREKTHDRSPVYRIEF